MVVVAARANEVGASADALCVDSPPAGLDCSDDPPSFHHVHCPVGSWDSLASLAFTFAGEAPPPMEFGQFCANLRGSDEPSWDGKTWSRFVRFHATKVFIVVTDDESDVPASAFDEWLLDQTKLPGSFGTVDKRRYSVYGLLGMDPQDPSQICSIPRDGGVAPGLVYQELADVTGGKLASICEDAYEPVMARFGQSIVDDYSCEFGLPSVPGGAAVDVDQVNVVHVAPGGLATTILHDTTQGCADGVDGWQWLANDRIVLCGDACERMKSTPQSRVEIQFGCDTQRVGP